MARFILVVLLLIGLTNGFNHSEAAYEDAALEPINSNTLEELPSYEGENDSGMEDERELSNSVEPQKALESEPNPETDANTAFIVPINADVGPICGLALDNMNRLTIFHRANRNMPISRLFNKENVFNASLKEIEYDTLLIVDSETGDILTRGGANQFLLPHGLSSDKEGNFWVSDAGSHQVFKLDSNFKVLMSLGTKNVPGSGKKHFCKPTDVAVASNGVIFVADGYCNGRIVKFDKFGNFVMDFGMKNKHVVGGPGELNVPHSIVLIESMDILCVADRDNQRIQCFSAGINDGHRAAVPTGLFLNKAEKIGNVVGVREAKNYLVGLTSGDHGHGLKSGVFVFDLTANKAKTYLRDIQHSHALAVSEMGTVYVGLSESVGKVYLNNPQSQHLGDVMFDNLQNATKPLDLIVFNKTTKVQDKIKADEDNLLKRSNDDVMDPYYNGYPTPFEMFRAGYGRYNSFGYGQPYRNQMYLNNGPDMDSNFIARSPIMNRNMGPIYNNNNYLKPYHRNPIFQPAMMNPRMRYDNKKPYFPGNEEDFGESRELYHTRPNPNNPYISDNYPDYGNQSPYSLRGEVPNRSTDYKKIPYRPSINREDFEDNYDEDFDSKNGESVSTINAPLNLHGSPSNIKKPKPEKGIMMNNPGYSYTAYIERQANMYPIMMYTLVKCVPCQRAKHLLAVQYSDVRSHFLELAGDEDWQRQLQVDLQHITGKMTFPYIFLCGVYIQGASNLFELHQQGQLRRIVNSCNPKKI
uniref:Peptidylamidoglycolate lyase n=1 Tax=Rhabditophanes sp. KR3021 TaxID=114890 RepID=A0AC35UB05_9BILA